MHDAARQYVAEAVEAHGPFDAVVEIGSRDVNGGVRDLFGRAAYLGIDLYDGPGVDVVGYAHAWTPPGPADAVVCCEVLEHDPGWRSTVEAAASWLAPGGLLVITCAGPGRRAHSGVDGAWGLRPGEHYENVPAATLADVLMDAELRILDCAERGKDTQARAVRP